MSMKSFEMLGETQVSDHVKRHFIGEISPRRLAYANSLLELCRILEGQYLLHRDHVDLLKMYMPRECTPFLEHVFTQWTQVPTDNRTNVYAEMRLMPQLAAPIRQTAPQNLGELLDDHKQSIYGLIASDIGKKWREFGRELGVSEGHMDDVDAQHRESMIDKVHSIFAKFEERTKPRKRYGMILRALEQVRRKDLARSVQDLILDE